MTRTRAIETRSPRPNEKLLTAVSAAQRLGLSRQAVDTAIREGRIPGFKSTTDQRIYVDRRYVEDREEREDLPTRHLHDHVAQLEQTLAGLETSRSAENSAVNAALRDAMVMVLAAAEERQLADAAAERAKKQLRKYRKLRAEADGHSLAAEHLYREALKTLNLPPTPP